MDPTEQNESASANDRESLERSLESFRAYLLFVAWRIKGNRLAGTDGASDLVQRTLLAALEKVRKGNIPGTSEKHRKAWLRKILYNTLKKGIRYETAEIHGGVGVIGRLEAPVPDPTTSPSGKAIKIEEELLLAEKFARLEPDEQQLITWRYIDGWSCEEIGRRRGCSASYVSRICNEIVRRLRTSLND
jgi:RNA polymerase sigma factor (sigma-70 family)